MGEEAALRIRRANPKEYEKVRDFYYLLIDAMEGAAFSPGWSYMPWGFTPNSPEGESQAGWRGMSSPWRPKMA